MNFERQIFQCVAKRHFLDELDNAFELAQDEYFSKLTLDNIQFVSPEENLIKILSFNFTSILHIFNANREEKN